jgi:hypothetical protein
MKKGKTSTASTNLSEMSLSPSRSLRRKK